MSVVETILVFVVIPASAVAVIAVLIWGRGAAGAPRYRPGREWPHEPVWYAPHPLAVDNPTHSEPPARRTEFAIGSDSTAPTPAEAIGHTAAGGARGTW